MTGELYVYTIKNYDGLIWYIKKLIDNQTDIIDLFIALEMCKNLVIAFKNNKNKIKVTESGLIYDESRTIHNKST